MSVHVCFTIANVCQHAKALKVLHSFSFRKFIIAISRPSQASLFLKVTSKVTSSKITMLIELDFQKYPNVATLHQILLLNTNTTIVIVIHSIFLWTIFSPPLILSPILTNSEYWIIIKTDFNIYYHGYTLIIFLFTENEMRWCWKVLVTTKKWKEIRFFTHTLAFTMNSFNF